MNPQSNLFLITVSLVLGATPSVLAGGSNFSAIDFPGATSTQVWGMNSSGDITGLYVGADKATHGFLRSRGQFTSIDFPGAGYTRAIGISPNGDIVGDYAATSTGSGPHHGFVLRRDGTFTTIDYPGAVTTLCEGMNSRGDIVGVYAFADNVNHIFVMSANQFSSNGQFIAIDDLPADLSTALIAVHSVLGAEITGAYQSSDKVIHGYVLSDGHVTTVDGPGNPTFTNVTGINSRGEMIGRYMVNGITHAYLLSGGQFSTFDYPDAILTAFTAISPNGDIAGIYRDASNVLHGFLLTSFRLACAAGN